MQLSFENGENIIQKKMKQRVAVNVVYVFRIRSKIYSKSSRM